MRNDPKPQTPKTNGFQTKHSHSPRSAFHCSVYLYVTVFLVCVFSGRVCVKQYDCLLIFSTGIGNSETWATIFKVVVVAMHTIGSAWRQHTSAIESGRFGEFRTGMRTANQTKNALFWNFIGFCIVGSFEWFSKNWNIFNVKLPNKTTELSLTNWRTKIYQPTLIIFTLKTTKKPSQIGFLRIKVKRILVSGNIMQSKTSKLKTMSRLSSENFHTIFKLYSSWLVVKVDTQTIELDGKM